MATVLNLTDLISEVVILDGPTGLLGRLAATLSRAPADKDADVTTKFNTKAEPDGSIQACEWYLLAAKGLRGAQLQKVQSAYERASLGLTPVQTAEVGRFVQGWAPKLPAIAANPQRGPGRPAA